MKYGYVRVSTKEQNLARQLEQMKNIGIPDDCIFQEKKSGKNLQREEFKRLLDRVREGDCITVTEISRLGRNMRDIVNVLYDLESRGVNIISIKEQIDTSTAMGKILFNIAGILAEIERESILDRQKQGIELAKRDGRMTGRPKCECKEFEKVYRQYEEGKIDLEQVLKLLDCSSSTFYRRVRDYKEKQYQRDSSRFIKSILPKDVEDEIIDFG